MRKIFKFWTLFVLSVLVMGLLSGCGGGNKEAVKDSSSETSSVSDTKNDDKNSTSVSEEKKANTTTSSGKKKIVIVSDIDDDWQKEVISNIISTLNANGYDDKNNEIIQLQMHNDTSEANIKKITDEIIKIKADIVFSPASAPIDISTLLESNNIPVISAIGVDESKILNEDGTPISNTSCVRAFPDNIESQEFALLNQIAPINGKKVAFIVDETFSGIFTKDKIQNALKKMNIELKDYVIPKFLEEQTAAVEKYNNDNEVGWIILGNGCYSKKDGTKIGDQESMGAFINAVKKPNVMSWDVPSMWGILCSAAVDLNETGVQMTEMGIRILKGENIKNIKAESPRKVIISINQKTAQKLGIEIPSNILSAAYRVYTDYEGNYIGKK